MTNLAELPKLYRELAEWWPLLSAPADYGEEAEFYARAMRSASQRTIEQVVEFGSGGGNNASHLKKHFQMTLVDLSEGMLAVSRRLNPECEHLQGDMRTARLGRQFDAVFVHDAIAYLTSEPDLRAAIETAYQHCRPGGVALFAPDMTRESFTSSTKHGGHDGGDRSLRYLEWTWDPDPSDSTYLVLMIYLLRAKSEKVHTVEDLHVCGLFSESEWLRFMADSGFSPQALPFEHSEPEPGSAPVFIGQKGPLPGPVPGTG